MSDLFNPEPERWGLRGDPHLWRALRDRLAGTELPGSAAEAGGVLRAAFADLAGVDLAGGQSGPVYLKQFAHGGMSSGMISLDLWRQTLLPLLTDRAAARRDP